MPFLSFIKNKRFYSSLGVFFIFSFSLCVGCYFRLYPLINHLEEDASEKATVLVLSQIRSQIQKDVNTRYPKLIPEAKALIRKQLFDQFLRAEKDKFLEQVNKVTKEIISSTSQEKKYPYLLASDSFYYYELTENLLSQGHLGEKVKGSKYFNKMMLAPNGHWVPLTWHPYVGLGIFKIMRFFDKGVPLMYAVSYTPLLITGLSILIFLLLTRLLQVRFLSSLIATLFFALAPIFVKRTTFGWYDNDPYNVLFPLLILLIFFYGIKRILRPTSPSPSVQTSSDRSLSQNKKTFKQALLTGLLCSVVLLVYTLFWQGWVLIFGLLFISACFILLFNHFGAKNKTQTLPLASFFGMTFCGSFLLISVAFGLRDFFTLFQEGWTALKGFLEPQLSVWPDIYISVGELHSLSWGKLIEDNGGLFFFLITLLGFVSVLIKAWRHPKKETSLFGIVLILFFIATTYIALGAQRFVLLCIVPWGLLFAIGLQSLIDLSLSFSVKFFSQKKITGVIFNILIIGALLATCFFPIQYLRVSMPNLLNPIYNSVWDKILKDIRAQTPEESIINSWWPPGHFIRSMARRKVTFDGGTINFPQAYWMASALLATSEEESLGILRMLNDSGNEAAELLQETMPTSRAVALLKDTVKLDDISARLFLEGVLKDKESANQLVSLTHATPPPSYLLLYKEFVEKNLQLAYIGRWNFKAVEIINQNPDLLKKIPKRGSKEYIDFLWSLVGGQIKFSGLMAAVNVTDDEILFPDNIRINRAGLTCTVKSDKYGKGIPYSLFYIDNGHLKEKIYENGNLSYSAIFLEENNYYYIILLDRQLARSMLIRLFYFNGIGLKYFHPFLHQSDLTNRNEIQVYQIDWEKFEEDLAVAQGHHRIK